MRCLTPAPSLAATPAPAAIEYPIERQCGGRACEPSAGGPMVLEQTGNPWQAGLVGSVRQAAASTTMQAGGDASPVIPPQGGMSNPISDLILGT
ncbi:MAG: hypothetical protein ACK4P8_00530 [Tabrizicola sp.]